MVPAPDGALTAPPQVLAALGGVATASPAGRLSVNASALAATALAVLSMEKVSVDVPPVEMALGRKTFENAGGGSICSMAVAGAATWSPLAVRLEVVLAYWPGAVPAGTASETAMLQVSLGPRLPPTNVRKVDPDSWEPLPQRFEIGVPVAARPGSTAFRLSVKLRPDTPLDALRFSMVKVSTGLPVAVLGPSKALENATLLTRSVSLAGLPPTGKPEAVPVTPEVVLTNEESATDTGNWSVTLKVHDPPAASVPPDS